MVYEYTKPRGPIAAMYSSPGPCYALPTLVGSQNHDTRSNQKKAPAYQFGIKHKAYSDESSPGPVYSLPPLETNINALPHWSMSSRKFPPAQAKLNVPGPGNYEVQTSNKHVSESAPCYSFGLRARGRKSDTAPAPNNYQLPQIVGHKHVSKQSAPQYTMTGRSKVGGFDEDLKKTPGPGAYNVGEITNVVKDKAPVYSMSSRRYLPGDATIKPGPGAHSVSPGVKAVTNKAPAYSFGLRHSQFSAPVADLADIEE